MPRFCQRWCRLTLLFLTGLILTWGISIFSAGQIGKRAVAADPQSIQSISPKLLVQQGIERYQIGKFTEAITLWQQALSATSNTQEKAVIHSNLAMAHRQIGQLNQAISHWEQAIQIARNHPSSRKTKNERNRQLAELLTEQAQAYSDLGQHRRAISLLQPAVEMSQQAQDQRTEAAALGALGNAYWALGDYEQALTTHQKSLKIANTLNHRNYLITALNNLGNVYVSRATRYRYQAGIAEVEGERGEFTRLTQLVEQDTTAARQNFEQAVQESRALGGMVEVRALLNLNQLLATVSSPESEKIASNRNRAITLLEQLSDSRDKAYALINIAESLIHQPSSLTSNSVLTPQPHSSEAALTVLNKALAVARNIGDLRAESFALGSLGRLYESAGTYETAMELTRQAQLAAQQVNAADSLYRWQWQAGRILEATGEQQQAITSFTSAIATLQSIRGDIVVANKELQFNFRDDVEPVYRGLMELLLEQPSVMSPLSSASSQGSMAQVALTKETPQKQVINILESLKLAELQNFFGDECVQVALNNAERNSAVTDSQTGVIYSVVLAKHTEIILQLPDGRMTSYRVPLDKKQIRAEVEQLRFSLEERENYKYLNLAKKVYDLLIRPMEADLVDANLRTLVFINDDVLRQLPMAALHDGQSFLVEKYAVATTPSINLTTRKPLDQQNLKALTLGLTVERPPFPALSNVNAEVSAVQKILGGTQLVDNAFTLNNFQSQLQKESYPIVHMATHGKFGVDAENTFLLGFDNRISIEQIDNILRAHTGEAAVQLLTLSACQTAAGDNRSALGIAGVAVRAGVESALATLWYINDEATVPLIEEFYAQLSQPNITKAQALQKAQLKMIADPIYNHPAIWSAFILIGNWL